LRGITRRKGTAVKLFAGTLVIFIDVALITSTLETFGAFLVRTRTTNTAIVDFTIVHEFTDIVNFKIAQVAITHVIGVIDGSTRTVAAGVAIASVDQFTNTTIIKIAIRTLAGVASSWWENISAVTYSTRVAGTSINVSAVTFSDFISVTAGTCVAIIRVNGIHARSIHVPG
jgi:hypothetical protein